MEINDKVLNFIKEFKGNDIQNIIMTELFTKGNCYQFYKILKSVFNKAEAYFIGQNECEWEHIITKINNKYYDINGLINISEYSKKYNGCLYKLDNNLKDLKCNWGSLPKDINKNYIKEFINQYYNLNNLIIEYYLKV